MSAYDKEQIEARLAERVEALERARNGMRRERAGMLESELSDIDNHPADQGTETHEVELDSTTEILLEEEIHRIEEARRALASGTYGTCLDCGTEISEARLEAVPEAVRCITCQRGFEARHRQANRSQRKPFS
jgi:RNA polymerase-binding transcription factor DksA